MESIETKDLKAEVDPHKELQDFVVALRHMLACKPALEMVAKYRSLEDVWDFWDHAVFAAWFIARVIGKAVAETITRKVVMDFLLRKHPEFALEIAPDLSLADIRNRLRERKDLSPLGRNILEDVDAVVTYESRCLTSANGANMAVVDSLDASGPEERLSREAALLKYLRDLVPKERFLSIAREMIREDQDETIP